MKQNKIPKVINFEEGNIAAIDEVAKIKGVNATAMIRECVDYYLKSGIPQVVLNGEAHSYKDILNQKIDSGIHSAKKFICKNMKMIVHEARIQMHEDGIIEFEMEEECEACKKFIVECEYRWLVSLMEYMEPTLAAEFEKFILHAYESYKHYFQRKEIRVLNGVFDINMPIQYDGMSKIDVFEIMPIESGVELKQLVEVLENKYGLILVAAEPESGSVNEIVLKALIEDEIGSCPMLIANRNIHKRISGIDS